MRLSVGPERHQGKCGQPALIEQIQGREPVIGLAVVGCLKWQWLRETNLWRKRTSPRAGSDLHKGHRPEGDVGEAKEQDTLLPPLQSEEAESCSTLPTEALARSGGRGLIASMR
jgi:hypothetical protein